MNQGKKILMGTLALAFLLGAAPLFAQADGHWAGTGTGHTHPPIPIPLYIEAWKYWEGEVEGEEFAGEWRDDFEHGYFEGTLTFSSVTEAHCEGEWYWISANGEAYLMGPFKMTFYIDGNDCKGQWEVYHDEDVGTMKGRKID